MSLIKTKRQNMMNCLSSLILVKKKEKKEVKQPYLSLKRNYSMNYSANNDQNQEAEIPDGEENDGLVFVCDLHNETSYKQIEKVIKNIKIMHGDRNMLLLVNKIGNLLIII